MPPSHRSRPIALAVVLMALSLAFAGAACAQEDAPEVPAAEGEDPDPALVSGREVWSERCARCHGAAGDGRSGPRLSGGRAEELHPEIESMIEVITEGRGAMPSFEGTLSAEEIESVARYAREVL